MWICLSVCTCSCIWRLKYYIWHTSLLCVASCLTSNTLHMIYDRVLIQVSHRCLITSSCYTVLCAHIPPDTTPNSWHCCFCCIFFMQQGKLVDIDKKNCWRWKKLLTLNVFLTRNLIKKNVWDHGILHEKWWCRWMFVCYCHNDHFSPLLLWWV